MLSTKISILIISFNTKEFLKSCLLSIILYLEKLNHEIVVIDNNSFDDPQEMLKTEFPFVKLITNNRNFGFGQANNQGAEVASGDILFFLNPDTLIQENIFQKIIEIFEANPRVGIVAPQLVVPDSSPQPWAYGKEEGLWQLVKNKFCPVSTQVPKYPRQRRGSPRAASNQVPNTDWVSGAALAIRREIFEKVGGFDENFFMYFEDRDLCYRVRQLGYKIIVLPEIKVVHFGGKSLTKNKERKKLYYQSQSYYWRKHYGLAVSLLLRLIRWPYKFYILNIQK